MINQNLSKQEQEFAKLYDYYNEALSGKTSLSFSGIPVFFKTILNKLQTKNEYEAIEKFGHLGLSRLEGFKDTFKTMLDFSIKLESMTYKDLVKAFDLEEMIKDAIENEDFKGVSDKESLSFAIKYTVYNCFFNKCSEEELLQMIDPYINEEEYLKKVAYYSNDNDAKLKEEYKDFYDKFVEDSIESAKESDINNDVDELIEIDDVDDIR